MNAGTLDDVTIRSGDMEQQIVQFLASLIGAAVGAAVAGYLGVRFGLLKVRSERAFDRQLGWYETTVTKLAAASQAFRALEQSSAMNESPIQVLRASTSAIQSRLTPLTALLIEARIYATPATYPKMEQLADDLSMMAATLLVTCELEGMTANELTEGIQKFAGAFAAILHDGALVLAKDARRQLGFAEAPTHHGVYEDLATELEVVRNEMKETLRRGQQALEAQRQRRATSHGV